MRILAPRAYRQLARHFWKTIFAAGLAFNSLAADALAANIEFYPKGEGEPAVIIIEGSLESTDAEKFANLAISASTAIVAFQSNGGDLVAGIDIGKAIRLKGFTTYVPDRVQCASACALAWLEGARRFMSSSAFIGFHAAYSEVGGLKNPDPAANALVGAYLNQLGLPNAAVIYITETPPDKVTWLNFVDAQKYGIDVKELSIDKQPNNSALEKKDTPSRDNPISLERRATATISELYLNLSRSNAASLSYLNSVYADPVSYFGQTKSKRQVMEAQFKYFESWPERKYEIIPNTVVSFCNLDFTCLISGQLKWFARSTARNIQSVGVWDFSYKVDLNNETPRFLLEYGHVVSRSRQPVQDGVSSSGLPQPGDFRMPGFADKYSYPINIEADNWLALRGEPGGALLMKMPPETLFTVFGEDGNWAHVRLRSGDTGWAFKRFIGCCRSAPP